MKCDKCFASDEDTHLVPYTNLLQNWVLCVRCDNVCNNTAAIITEFLKEDFGNLPISQVDKNMINARKNKNLGLGQWDKERTEK